MFASLFRPSIPRATADLLARSLFSNLFDDVWYARFPRIPGPVKERLAFGGFQVTHLLSRGRQSLVVSVDGAWIGTLVLHRGEMERRDRPRFSHFLPSSDSGALERLLEAALAIARIDAQTRGDSLVA